MPSSSRWNPSRRQREAQRANRSNTRKSEFLQVIELQLQAVTARETTLRHQQRSIHRSRSRSRSPSRTQPPAYRSHSRDRSPLETRPERRYRTRSPRPPRVPSPHLDLNPHEEAGRTARPSPEEEESVLGWSAFSEERDRSTQTTPRNPFAADTYRPDYENRNAHLQGQRDNRPARASYRGSRPARRGRGSDRGRGQNRGRGSGRSLFDRINL
jgi:hypothetical protein